MVRRAGILYVRCRSISVFDARELKWSSYVRKSQLLHHVYLHLIRITEILDPEQRLIRISQLRVDRVTVGALSESTIEG